MAYLSDYARRKKLAFFIDPIPKNANVLEVGCGGNWVRDYMQINGWTGYTGIDLFGKPDILGDLKDWRKLGLQAASYDVLIAFEVVEHDDLWQAMFDLLIPGGKLMLTTPVPSRDWILQLLEKLKLNQTRTSPHSHMLDVRTIQLFDVMYYQQKAGLSQWAILRKPLK